MPFVSLFLMSHVPHLSLHPSDLSGVVALTWACVILNGLFRALSVDAFELKFVWRQRAVCHNVWMRVNHPHPQSPIKLKNTENRVAVVIIAAFKLDWMNVEDEGYLLFCSLLRGITKNPFTIIVLGCEVVERRSNWSTATVCALMCNQKVAVNNVFLYGSFFLAIWDKVKGPCN